MKREDLQQVIRESVHAHSGGMKFSELLVGIVATYGRVTTDEMERAITEMDDVKVLKYAWHTAGMSREKFFVYTP